MQKQTYSCVNTPQPDLIKLIEGFGDFYMNYKNIDPPKSICSIIREYLESINMQPQPDYAKLLEEKDEAIRELVADLEQLNYWVNSENTKNLITKYKQP